MEVFYTTISIVFGILLPIVIILAVFAVVIISRSIPPLLELKVQELKKKPPFDEVETSIDMPTNSMKVRFIKNGDIVWAGTVTDNDGKLEVKSNGR